MKPMKSARAEFTGEGAARKPGRIKIKSRRGRKQAAGPRRS